METSEKTWNEEQVNRVVTGFEDILRVAIEIGGVYRNFGESDDLGDFYPAFHYGDFRSAVVTKWLKYWEDLDDITDPGWLLQQVEGLKSWLEDLIREMEQPIPEDNGYSELT